MCDKIYQEIEKGIIMKKTKMTITTVIMAVCVVFLATFPATACEVNIAREFKKAFDYMSVPTFFVSLFICLWFFLFVNAILGVIKGQKINRAMQRLSNMPNEQTAYEAIDELKSTFAIVRFMVSLSGRREGIRFEMWRDIFNNIVIPCGYIRPEVKRELREQLVKFNTYGLRNVTATHNPVRTPVQTPAKTPEEAQLAAKNFGVGGEDNVWHNLKVLASQPTCDVYRNVKIDNGTTSSEIDAVIVDENKGVFLIEIKSLGGRRAVDGFKHIAFSDLKYDPSNQIIRHQYDFTSCFSDMNLNGRVRNVLVFSWPNGEERRIVDKATFSSMPYDVISIEQLLTYYQTSNSTPITSEERKLIASKMGANSIC